MKTEIQIKNEIRSLEFKYNKDIEDLIRRKQYEPHSSSASLYRKANETIKIKIDMLNWVLEKSEGYNKDDI